MVTDRFSSSRNLPKISWPKVSVVIPCYNAGVFLRETLCSVLNQTHLPFEVLVIDDGSTDHSPAIARSFGCSVRVISQPNQGESVARNRGIAEAKGDWIAFLDADNIWKPRKLERQIAAIDPDTIAVHTNCFVFGTASGVVDVSKIPPNARYTIPHVCVSNPISPSSLLVRRDVPTRFPMWTCYGEDLVYNLDLITRGAIKLVSDPLTGIRRHDGNQSSNPAIETLWCDTVERWLSENAEKLTRQTIRRIRYAWVARLARSARKAKQQKDWEKLSIIRNYLLRRYPEFKVSTLPQEEIFSRSRNPLTRSILASIWPKKLNLK